MNPEFLIFVDGVPIGSFQNKVERDIAFEKYVVHNSDNCFVGGR